LGIAAVWAVYGALHFMGKGKAEGKTVLLESKPISM
jgi:hypothetical protein